MSKYEIGDKAVYPGHGVGEIEAIETKKINDMELSFYIMKIINSGLKIMVPVNNIKSTGMRDLIQEQDIEEVISILKERNYKIENITWNKRFKDYNERLKSGSIFEVASVLRDLVVLGKTKDLSFGEKRMYEMAVNLISQEISFVRNQSQSEVISELEKILKEG
jgi:CarD family transcriptional regulator